MFFAPVTGIYWFSYSVWCNGSTTVVEMGFIKILLPMEDSGIKLYRFNHGNAYFY